MRRQTARPLRACAVIFALYVGGRIGLGRVYPDLAVSGAMLLPPPGPSPPLRDRHGPLPGVPQTKRAIIALAEDVQADLLYTVATHQRAAIAFAPRAHPPPMSRPHPVVQKAGLLGIALVPKGETVTAAAQSIAPAAGSTQASKASAILSTTAPLPIDQPTDARSQFSGSAWLLVRQGSGTTSLATAGTLGGSQAGVRLNWRPAAAPVFLTIRTSAALAQHASEIAPGIGIAGRAGGIILEQRFRLERGRSSQPALLAYGGFSDRRVPAGIRADGYAQAGIVGLARPALFVDGAVRAERRVMVVDRIELGVGGGLWGAAQPGVARLDGGPQLVAHLPIGQRSARLAAEYRVRLAGSARPGSGLLLTIGTDF